GPTWRSGRARSSRTDRRQMRVCKSRRPESLISSAAPPLLAPSYKLRPRESAAPSQDTRGRGTDRGLLHGAVWLLRVGRDIQSKGSSLRPLTWSGLRGLLRVGSHPGMIARHVGLGRRRHSYESTIIP